MGIININIILFFIFVNSHQTHGTSCVNNPFYIRDQSQIVGHRYSENPILYRKNCETQYSIKSKLKTLQKSPKYLIDCIKKSVSFFSIIYNQLFLILCYVKIYLSSSKIFFYSYQCIFILLLRL